ncbi:hypothetical protein JCM10213_005518 [Rhodosporidiobolus nylandii]
MPAPAESGGPLPHPPSPPPSTELVHSPTPQHGAATAHDEHDKDEQEGEMGQAASAPHLERLQEQLEQSVMRSTTSFDASSIRSFSALSRTTTVERASAAQERPADEDDDGLFMATRQREGRRRRSSAGAAACEARPSGIEEGTWLSGKKKTKSRPASSYIPATTWAGQLSSLASPKKGSSPSPSSSPSASASSCATRAARSSSPLSSDITTPPRRSTSASPSPTSRRATPPSFRHSLRLPFLPSIPASPLPPILSPRHADITAAAKGMTRSQSSPPLLPPLSTGGPLSPTFALAVQPPTGEMRPSAGWPGEGDGEGEKNGVEEAARPRRPNGLVVSRSTTSSSMPNLALLASAPIQASFSAAPSTSPYFPPTTSATPVPTSDSPTPTTASPIPFAAEPASPELLTLEAALLVSDEQQEADQEKQRKAEQAKDEKRYHALVELVETEKAYREGLTVLVKVYFQTLPFLTLLTVPEVHSIIRNADALLQLHERIGERIEMVETELKWRKDGEQGKGAEEESEDQQTRARKAAGEIARVLEEELPNFELYNDFCARHAEALDIVRSISSRQEWEAYERQCATRASTFSASAAGSSSTPMPSRQNSTSPFFLPSASTAYGASPYAPASSASSAAATPSVGGTPFTVSSVSSAAASASAGSSSARSKLRFIDYAISPVQRITRYPLVLGQLAKYFAGTAEHEPIRRCWEGFKTLAAGVDAAKREREGEMRTRVVAQRMEFLSPVVGGAFCDILGPTLLVGALHVLHIPPPSAFGAQQELRVKYLGCFLYKTHLVMAKIKKRASYEPREWLPLRLFEISSVEDGQGLLTTSIRLTYRDHTFELGALCTGEKAAWLAQLLAAQARARETWDSQELDEHGQPTLFDDTVVSSVPANSPAPASAVPLPLLQRKSHSRSASSASVVSVFSAAASATTSPQFNSDEPLPPLPAEHAASCPPPSPAPSTLAALSSSPPLSHTNSTPLSSIMTTPQLSSRSRFSTTASSLLLGRTPSSQRAAVDLRLGDVFSEELLSARAQAARDAEEVQAALNSSAAAKRLRTVSGPKRSMTALTSAALPYAPYVMGASAASRMLAGGAVLPGAPAGAKLERRRMSSVEIGLGVSERDQFRGAIGLDPAAAVGYRDDTALNLASTAIALSTSTPGVVTVAATPERGRWANAIRKTKSSGASATGSIGRSGSGGKAAGTGSNGTGRGKTRPRLPDIDTALAESMARSSAGASRKSMAAPLSAGGSWSRRRNGRNGNDGPTLGGQLRRVASHNSLDSNGIPGTVRLPLHTPAVMVHPTTPSTPVPSVPVAAARASASAVSSSAVDVERNNSVSSTASSDETGGARSSSSHATSAAFSIAGSAVIETPPSSIPPSPDFYGVELDPLASAGAAPLFRKGSLPAPSTAPPTPNRVGSFPPSGASPSRSSSSHHTSPRSLVDGMSSVFRLRRRKSTLGLVPPAVAPLSPSASEEALSTISPSPSQAPSLISTPSHEELTGSSSGSKEASKAIKLQRRASTTLGGLFSAKARAQSHPTLAGSGGYFHNASSPHLPLNASPPESAHTTPATSAAPSATTTPATSPPASQPPTPAGGVVLDLAPAPLVPLTPIVSATATTGSKNKTMKARNRHFYLYSSSP